MTTLEQLLSKGKAAYIFTVAVLILPSQIVRIFNNKKMCVFCWNLELECQSKSCVFAIYLTLMVAFNAQAPSESLLPWLFPRQGKYDLDFLANLFIMYGLRL